MTGIGFHDNRCLCETNEHGGGPASMDHSHFIFRGRSSPMEEQE